ncbi:MAG TPA: MBL fold metallo-hydrolase [Candidatus Polarisedimenticolaceae bacterium]|nr:MBL fold metallo-hydrolase [Candidatus Polarisedimenticolaceae bacterium]
MIRFPSGSLQITILSAGSLWLDGGAMFGVVPKPLWAKLRAPDERNRIRLAMNVLLVEDGRTRVLIDNGAGTKWDDKQRDIYGFDLRSAEEILRPAGLVPGDIDIVLDSHLHFDHAGGNTAADRDGRLVAAFPNARYVVQRGELEFARSDNERIRASYQRDNFEPLVASGQFDFVEGDARVTDRIEVLLAPGHTPFLHVPVVRSGEHTIAFLADLVPTASHVPFPYIMGYDVEPLRTLESKKRILPRAAREGWRLVFEHDADLPLGILEETAGKLRAVPLAVEA